jgi:hypothetical protein
VRSASSFCWVFQGQQRDGSYPRQVVADWTLILTTIGTAVASGGFGYLAANKSADVTIRQINAEGERARDQIAAERDRLDAQHNEDHRKERQKAYNDLMAADRRFANAIIGRKDASEFFDEFSHLANSIAIFGAKSVGGAIQRLLHLYAEVFTVAHESSDDSSAAAVGAGLAPSRAERKKARDEGIEMGPPLTMHTLRRTFASHLILDLKLDAVQVSKQMGHAKPSITQDAYAELFDQARHHDEIRAQARPG